MDIQSDARRLASIATFFVWAGYAVVIYALVAGLFWWIDLVQRPAFNLFEALALSLGAIGAPIFLALIVAAFGQAMRLFALYVASKSQ